MTKVLDGLSVLVIEAMNEELIKSFTTLEFFKAYMKVWHMRNNERRENIGNQAPMKI